MIGYKIYLTKSFEIANLIQKAMTPEIGKNNLFRTSVGMADDYGCVPAIYYDGRYFCCILEYTDLVDPLYQIVFA